MPRPSRPWFRFYVEAVSDQKLRRLTPAQRWLWVAVLAVARQSPISGTLMISERMPMGNRELADLAAVPLKDVTRTLPIFEAAGMLERDEQLGAWRVVKWADRQFESDDVTERTRKHRSNTPRRNVPTPTEPRSRERPSNDHDTFPGTPPESESESESPPTSPRPTPDRRSNRQAEGTNPKLDKLVHRWLDTCDPGARTRLTHEAPTVIGHLLDYLDYQAIDECIGTCAQRSTSPPRSTKYLLQACREFAQRHLPGMTIPDPPTGSPT